MKKKWLELQWKRLKTLEKFYLKVRSYVNKKKYEEEMARAAMEEAENS